MASFEVGRSRAVFIGETADCMAKKLVDCQMIQKMSSAGWALHVLNLAHMEGKL